MNIVHLSTTDVSGGAARAAYRLHEGLEGLGINSEMFVRRKKSDDPAVHTFRPPSDLPSRLYRVARRTWLNYVHKRAVRSRSEQWGPFSVGRTQYGEQVAEQSPAADIANLHWISDFVDIEAFFRMWKGPVVWTLHDMNAFTGGCHYSDQCRRYRNACGACPQLGQRTENDLSRAVWTRKREAYAQVEPRQFHIVAPSRWLASTARESALLKPFEVSVIPYGLDTERFAPRRPEAVRRALGLSPACKVLAFVAMSTTVKRKGFALLADALSSLNEIEDLVLLSVGSKKPGLDTAVTHLHLGHIQSDRLLAAVYSAADAFVIPSLEDNLPNTVLESLACGTPVIGFDIGGIPDMVRDGETGYTVPAGDVSALRDAIASVLQADEKRNAMRDRCRKVAVDEYSLDVQARRYADLYTSLLNETSAEASVEIPRV